jgi:hypothetical protein
MFNFLAAILWRTDAMYGNSGEDKIPVPTLKQIPVVQPANSHFSKACALRNNVHGTLLILRIVIGFITILHVVTTITYYTVTYLHSLHANLFILSAVVFAYSVSLSLKHLNSLKYTAEYFSKFTPGTVRELTANCLNYSSCLQDNISTRTV